MHAVTISPQLSLGGEETRLYHGLFSCPFEISLLQGLLGGHWLLQVGFLPGRQGIRFQGDQSPPCSSSGRAGSPAWTEARGENRDPGLMQIIFHTSSSPFYHQLLVLLQQADQALQSTSLLKAFGWQDVIGIVI